MNESQSAKVDFLRNNFAPEGGYEFKRNEVVHLDGCGIVFLYLETGLIGDEDTMASVFARDRRQFKIGPRGGVESINKNFKWKRNIFETAL